MKKFYKEALAESADGGWRVMLDGRGIKTAMGAPQVVPNETLANALASEWDGQGEEIDPAHFLFRDMADYAIDVVRPNRDAAIGELLRYAETDTLCYRADPDEALFQRQQEVWEPLLSSIEARHGVRFTRVSGIMHRPQPPETLEAIRRHLAEQDDFALAALNTLASLSTSLSIALAALEEDADAEALWAAANCEEDWQMELWGKDYLAKERRDRRQAEFTNALRFARLTREEAS
ncbi:molecular chaperone [Croceicoccus estronivorus]|uniref:ATP12 family chaperone protein n=1 Tax=Croceicoccus estronivorus TaxID=1172626 RepID=UPI000831C8FB|nr:ATP12 family protein [Croceicoccus estronivorus]OCC25256.1 molecular chaperone [Croceicoccus estronivorus]